MSRTRSPRSVPTKTSSNVKNRRTTSKKVVPSPPTPTVHDLSGMVPIRASADELLKSNMRHAAPTVFLVDVTPDLAMKWLTKNTVENRNVATASMNQYMRDMLAGRWLLTGEPIIFDIHGKLRNGYHRLPACAAAGVSFTTIVMAGISPEAVIAMDQGRTRNYGDILKMRGRPLSAKMSSTVRFCYVYDNGMERTATKLSVPLLDSYEADHPEIEESMKWININRDIPISPTIVMGLRHIAIHELGWNEAFVDKFFEQLRTGTDLQEGDPALTLRKWLIKNATTHGRVKNLMYQVMLTKTMNAYFQNQKIRVLRWQREGDRPEDIPRLVPAISI